MRNASPARRSLALGFTRMRHAKLQNRTRSAAQSGRGRCRQQALGRVPADATDWDVAAGYVRLKIELMRGSAEKAGDSPRAAALTARLSGLNVEARARMARMSQVALSE